MIDTLRLVMVKGIPDPAAAEPAILLPQAGLEISSCSMTQALQVCKSLSPHAGMFIVSASDPEDSFAPSLKRISREHSGILLYVVSCQDVNPRLKLLAGDQVEGVFPAVPDREHLEYVIRRAMSLRKRHGSRLTSRYAVRFGCTVKVIGAAGLVEGEVRQIGLGGFMATLPKAFSAASVRDSVRFAIYRRGMPAHIRIEGDGEICWGDIPGDGRSSAAFGVCFKKMDVVSTTRLHSCLNRIRTTPTEKVPSAG